MTDRPERPTAARTSVEDRRRSGRRRRLRAAVPRLSRFAVEHLLLLPLGALVALIWVNTAPESYYRVTYRMAFAVNDIAMVFFFALIAKEVVEATAPGGVLHPWRRAMLPVFAAIGACVVPALLHVRLVSVFDEPMLALGWPIALGTDLAVSYFIARIVFRRHPMIAFLLLLGIASDALGFLAVAIVHPTLDLRPLSGGIILVIALALAAGIRHLRVKSFWPYLLGPGVLAWYACLRTGVHPALALVPIVPFMPHAKRDLGIYAEEERHLTDTMNQFHNWWHVPVQVILLLFALVNAGVLFSSTGAGSWMVLTSLLLGKPIGIVLFTALGIAAGLKAPGGIRTRDTVLLGITAGIGFTVALFFATAAFPPGELLDQVKMGALMSFVAFPVALIAKKLFHESRRPSPLP